MATIQTPNGVTLRISAKTGLNGLSERTRAIIAGMAQAAPSAGIAVIDITAGKEGGHLSHANGTEVDLKAYSPDGSLWTTSQRVALAAGAQAAGADRFGLYSFGKGKLGSGTMHVGFSGPGRPAAVWGANSKVRGDASRRFTDPAEKAFLASYQAGRPFDIASLGLTPLDTSRASPQDAQSAIASLIAPSGAPAIPDAPTAAMGFAPTIQDAGFPAPAASIYEGNPFGVGAKQPPTPPMPQPPPQWAQAGGFPVAGGQGQEQMLGGPVPPMPRMRDQGTLDQQRADQLDEAMFGAGPHRGDFARGRPDNFVWNGGGAPDAASVAMPNISPRSLAAAPAVGGPNDRRPQPPTPPTRPDNFVWNGGGAPGDPPTPPMRPTPAEPLTDEDRQRILADLADFRQRDQPYSPMVAGMPDIPRPEFQSRIAGRPEFPGAIQPPRNDVPELPPPSEPRVPASTALTPALMDRLRQAQGIGPFPSRPEYPGALPAAPNPYDDPSRQFDIPDPFTLMADSQPPPAPTPPPEARTKDDAYTPGRDFSIAAPAPLITQNIPPSPFGPTGNVVGPQDDAGSGRQPFIDANRAPTPIDSTTGTWSGLPDPTPPGLPSPSVANWRDQFNISFSPGGPGMIYDMTPPAPPPSSQAGNPFDALMGPGAAMGAVPFNDMAQGIGAPDFSAARPPSPFDSAPTSDLGLGVPPKPALMSGASAFYRPDAPDPTFAGGSVVSPNSPNAIGATDTQAMPGRIFVDPAKYGQPPTPPPSPVAQSATMGLPEPGAAPRQTNPGAERQRNSIMGRVLGGLLGGPLGALGGGLLGGGGGGFGFGQGATVTGMGPTFSAPYMQSNGQMGNTNVQRVQAGNMQGTMWNRNNGGSVGYVTDPFTGAMIHAGSPNTVGGGGLY